MKTSWFGTTTLRINKLPSFPNPPQLRSSWESKSAPRVRVTLSKRRKSGEEGTACAFCRVFCYLSPQCPSASNAKLAPTPGVIYKQTQKQSVAAHFASLLSLPQGAGETAEICTALVASRFQSRCG